VPVLRRALLSPDPVTRARAAVALWNVDKQAEHALPVLIEAIESPVLRPGVSGPLQSPYSQEMSMSGMGSRFSTSRSGRPVPVEDVREVRREALSTLGRMGSKARDAATALADAAREVDEPTRRAALDALKAVEPVAAGSGDETEPGASTRTSPSDPDPRG
jgi:HEAT repeat protein